MSQWDIQQCHNYCASTTAPLNASSAGGRGSGPRHCSSRRRIIPPPPPAVRLQEGLPRQWRGEHAVTPALGAPTGSIHFVSAFWFSSNRTGNVEKCSPQNGDGSQTGSINQSGNGYWLVQLRPLPTPRCTPHSRMRQGAGRSG